MAKVTVLGGAGAVGSVAVKTLVEGKFFSDIVVADANLARAQEVAAAAGLPGVTAAKVDAGDPASIKKVVKGSDVLLNCVGPFYKFATTVMGAAAAAKVNYVDVCDDLDATQKQLAMHDEVKAAGITALVGMGSSPGVANVLARASADYLLDETDSVDIYHAHGGEKEEGRAVIAHRIHSMIIDIPVFLDGRMQTVRLFEESGRAIEEVADFETIGEAPVYGYPHPETITLPAHIPGIKRVTNLGTVLPVSYANLIKSVVRAGCVGEEPLDVHGQAVVPHEFAISYILSERPRLLREAGVTEASGCLQIVVKGRKAGEAVTYIFSLSSKGQGMGEGTGIPAALGAVLMGTGKLPAGAGVLPPEACVNPIDFFGLVTKVMGGSGKPSPLKVKRIAGGKTEVIDLFAVADAAKGKA